MANQEVSVKMDNKDFRKFIRRKLEKADFVEWDRYTEWNWEGDKVVRVYGWIDREDSHEDFVLLEFVRNDGDAKVLSTSSSDYSEELLHIIEDVDYEEMGEEHVECNRVEDLYPDIENKIELEGDRY
jgi:hypothetical protein